MSTAEHKTDPWSSFEYSTASRKESNMDPELASIVSSLSGLSNPSGTHLISGPQQLGGFRRSSLNSNNGSDVESELIFQGHVSPTARRSTLSVGAVPTATSSSGHRLAMLGHYSASINTGALQTTNQGGSFFERFGRSLAEATREVEQNLGSHTSRNLRRDSVPNGSGSIDILSRVSTATAIAGDDQNRRKASVSSDALESVSESLSLQNETNASKNIWNVANAPVFRPSQMESVVNPEVYQSMYCGFPYGLFGHYTAGVANNAPGSVYLPNSTYTTGVQPVNVGDADDAVSRNADQPEGTEGGQFVFPLATPLVYFPNNTATPTVSPNTTAANANTTTTSPAAPAVANVMPYAHPRYSPNDSQKSKPKVNPYLQPNIRSHNAGSTISQRNVTKVPIQSGQDGNNHYYQPHSHKNYASLQPQKQQQNLERQQHSQSPAQSQQQQVHTQAQVHSQPQQHQMSSGTSSKRNGKNQQTIVRSPLLEEFRTNPTNKSYKLHEIYGSALEFCKDQHGSRFIQQELANATDIEKEIIFNEIRDRAIELSHDVFGNYVIQKFFEFGTKTQKDILVEQFKGKLEMLSLEMYACRVIQRAFEFIDEEQKIELVTELSSCVLTMIKDQNGNHVIQKTIECIPMSKLPFILESLKGQIYHLSTHFYGCRVVQRLLEYGSKEDQEEILNELDQFIPYLVQDQYGNYVIQHILQRGGNDPTSNHIDKSKQDIVDTISKTVVEFSKHKFASNVVEKTILYGSPSQTRQVLDKILPKNEEHAANLEDTSPLILMMRDQYANYVVQKLVGVATGNDKKLIVIAIRSYLERLNKNNTLGNRHLASVEKLAALVEKVKV